MNSFKVCTGCGIEKPATAEYFYRSKAENDGLRHWCKVCASEYQKENYRTNKEFRMKYIDRSRDKYRTTPYGSWYAVMLRCYRKNRTDFKYYGGRGIKVCEAWHDYHVFEVWALKAGWAHGLTIDRIDPAGNYEENNCRFITKRDNSRRRFGYEPECEQ